jgi:hypothetical protein
MRLRMRVVSASLACATALVVGACSSSTPVATDTTKAPVTTAPPVTLSPSQQTAALQAGTLTAADLGDGWSESATAQNRAIDADTFSFVLAEPTCAKVLESIDKNAVVERTTSPRFANATGQTAENTVTVMKTESDAEKLVLVLGKDSSSECLANAFENGLKKVYESEEGVTVSSVRVKKLTGLTIGALRAGFEVTVDFKKGDEPLQTVIVTRVAAQEGPVLLDFTFGSQAFAFPDPVKVMTEPVSRVEAIVEQSATTTTA